METIDGCGNKRRLPGFKVASSFISAVIHLEQTSCYLRVFSEVAVSLPTFMAAIYNLVGQLFRFDSMHVVHLCKQKGSKSTARQGVRCDTLPCTK